MPFPMKIQPIDSHTPQEWTRYEPVKPPGKWRFRRLFERQLPNKPSEKAAVDEPHHGNRDGWGSSNEFDPSSACLAKMVQNFIEDDKQSTVRCGRNRCNCFNGNGNDDSGDELDGFFGSGGESSSCLFSSSGEPCEVLKSLVPCASVAEWNLLADATKIIDKNKISKRKDQFCRKIVVDGLVELGYDASICTSRWDQAASYPAGEYEYVDVITIEGDRFLIDIDFRSEFEIARPTKSYKAVLQTLPHVFVGKSDRLQKIVVVATEAAKQSLKKKGMPVPPWRRSGYVNAKWVSPHTRTGGTSVVLPPSSSSNHPELRNLVSGEPADEAQADSGELLPSLSSIPGDKSPPAKEWQPPAVKPKSLPIGVKIVTGLASVIGEKP